MTKMSLETDGSIDEVVRVIRRLGNAGGLAAVGDAGRPMKIPTRSGGQAASYAGTRMGDATDAAVPAEWTETLAYDFLVGLDTMARRMRLHVWRAGAAGIHRSALCQRAGLTPAGVRSLLMGMGRALRRFQQERGMTLSCPVAANSPLQTYFVDPDFSAVVPSYVFDHVGRSGGFPSSGGRGR